MDKVKQIRQLAEMLQQVLIKMHRVLQQLEPQAVLTKVRSRRE
jgi:DNA-binding transcriptional regulator YhcF (GntR family)